MPVVFFQLWGCFLTLCRLIHYRQSKTPGGYRGFAFLMRGGDSELFNYLGYYNTQ